MTTLLAFDALEWSTIALAAATSLLAAVAAFQLFAALRSEGRRSQPVAIAHHAGPRDQVEAFRVYLTNEGTGAAFNVRFGVVLDGAEYLAGGGRGNRYLVAAGARVPAEVTATLSVRVSPAPYGLAIGGPGIDDRAIFFARYTDSVGRTWETRNPADAKAELQIRRAPRLLRLHEWRHAKTRSRRDRIFARRLAEEGAVGLDLSQLTRRQRLRRRFERL